MNEIIEFIKTYRGKVNTALLIVISIMYFMVCQNFFHFHYKTHFHVLYMVISIYLITKNN